MFIDHRSILSPALSEVVLLHGIDIAACPNREEMDVSSLEGTLLQKALDAFRGRIGIGRPPRCPPRLELFHRHRSPLLCVCASARSNRLRASSQASPRSNGGNMAGFGYSSVSDKGFIAFT